MGINVAARTDKISRRAHKRFMYIHPACVTSSRRVRRNRDVIYGSPAPAAAIWTRPTSSGGRILLGEKFHRPPLPFSRRSSLRPLPARGSGLIARQVTWIMRPRRGEERGGFVRSHVNTWGVQYRTVGELIDDQAIVCTGRCTRPLEMARDRQAKFSRVSRPIVAP